MKIEIMFLIVWGVILHISPSVIFLLGHSGMVILWFYLLWCISAAIVAASYFFIMEYLDEKITDQLHRIKHDK